MAYLMKRDQWSYQWESTLALGGYIMGSDFITTLPTGLYLYGGGPYLLLNILFTVIIGAPLLFMLLSLGQYCSSGPLTCWRFAPIVSGLGLSFCIYEFLQILYFVLLPTWLLLLLSNIGRILDADCSTFDNCSKILMPIFNDIFGERQTDEFDTERYGPIDADKAGAMFGIYLIVFACLILGVKVYGKLTYITTVFPFVAIVALFIRAVTLEGAMSGIQSYFTTDFSIMKEYKTWTGAFRRTLSMTPFLSIACISYGSYNKFSNDTFRDTGIATVCKVGYIVFAAFSLAGFKGHIAYIWNIPANSYMMRATGMFEVTYMMIASSLNLPISAFWIALFLLSSFILHLNILNSVILGLVTAINDLFPVLSTCKGFTWISSILTSLNRKTSTFKLKMFRGKIVWMVVLAIICILLFLLALPMTRQGQVPQMLTFFDYVLYHYAIDPLHIICLCIAVMLFYGALKFCNDIDVMVNSRILCCIPWKIVKVVCIGLWCLFPLLMILQMVGCGIEHGTHLEFYPSTIEWQYPLGKFLLCFIMLPIPIVAIVVFLFSLLREGSFSEKIRSCFSPTKEWGPLEVENRQLVMNRYARYGLILDPWSQDQDNANNAQPLGASSLNPPTSTNDVQVQMAQSMSEKL